MRAERDEDDRDYDYKLTSRKKERRLAYEIALGIIIGFSVLWVLELVVNFITYKLAMNEIKIMIDGWKQSPRMNPFE